MIKPTRVLPCFLCAFYRYCAQGNAVAADAGDAAEQDLVGVRRWGRKREARKAPRTSRVALLRQIHSGSVCDLGHEGRRKDSEVQVKGENSEINLKVCEKSRVE